MDELVVHSSTHQYSIKIGEHIRNKIGSFIGDNYTSVFIITDTTVGPLYLQDVVDSLEGQKVFSEVIDAGEASKNINSYYELQTKAIEYGLDRKSLIVALGGGVVGDLAGFVASTYMRGIDYIQVPTTILAHDSSVGGKVAINHGLGKNLIGAFYSPKMVVYDVETLHTLPEKEIRSGYAELIKEALIADQEFFNELININIFHVDNADLVKHLKTGMEIKANIVEQDEKESGIRKYLNLGHTLGHALEAELGYGKLTHGEAVAIGLLFAIYLSEQILHVDLPYEKLYTWFKSNIYPLKLEELDERALIQKMKSDKKAINNNVQMVLLNSISQPVVKDITDEDLQWYLKSFLEELNMK